MNHEITINGERYRLINNRLYPAPRKLNIGNYPRIVIDMINGNVSSDDIVSFDLSNTGIYNE